MKVLVFSDSHGKKQPMVDLVALHAPDAVFHLGDVVRDTEPVRLAYPGLSFYQVPGNCDRTPDDPDQEGVARLAGKTVFFLHGHTRHVKLGYGAALHQAKALGADALLFGHTHTPLRLEADGVLVLNPGALQNGRYALLTWEPGTAIDAQLLQL